MAQFSTSLIGPLVYMAVWLGFMQVDADLSERLAVVGLMVVTALYCFAVARSKGRAEALWGAFGAMAAFVELGLIPVVLVSLLAARRERWPFRAANEQYL